jgi:RNA polymerase sigma-70 factor, ECF subfamily
MAGRDREAEFSRFVESELDRSYRTAYLILRNEADAEDATHDAILKAWRAWPRLREVDRFSAWFGRILVNECRDRLRHASRARALERGLPGVASISPAPGSDPDLEQAFTALNADQRVAVVLRFWADLTVDQIAERVKAPAGTVKSRLHHALLRMRGVLEASEVTR